MFMLVAVSAISLAALQSSINAPTEAFRGCLREASSKATTEKVGPDAIEAYLRSACTVQMDSLKRALVSFRVKNGMAKKTAGEDANMTVEDYVATPADKYRFMSSLNAKPAAPASVPAAVQTAVQTAVHTVAQQPPK